MVSFRNVSVMTDEGFSLFYEKWRTPVRRGLAFALGDELTKLTNYIHSDEGYGTLLLETDDAVTWTSRYEGHEDWAWVRIEA